MPTNPGHFQWLKLIVMPMAPLHPLKKSHLATDNLDNSNNPKATLIGSHQLLISALGHPSPLQCSGLVPALDGLLGIHPICDGAKTHHRFPSNPNPLSPYSNS